MTRSNSTQDRNVSSSSEWRRGIQEVDAAILDHMRTGINGGFDEERFGQHVGFGNLKWCYRDHSIQL